MTATNAINIIEYDERHAWPTVRMWRASMERALGVKDPHSWDEQLAYLRELATENQAYLAVEEATDQIVGFMVVGGTELAQLYIHVDYQGLGLGARFLALAKAQSPGKLQLYTFAINHQAQRFYEKHGFTIIGRGIEPESGMADIRYEWVAERDGPDFIVIAGAPGAGKSTISELLHQKYESCLIDFGDTAVSVMRSVHWLGIGRCWKDRWWNMNTNWTPLRYRFYRRWMHSWRCSKWMNRSTRWVNGNTHP